MSSGLASGDPLDGAALCGPPTQSRDPEAEDHLDDEEAQTLECALIPAHNADQPNDDPDGGDYQRSEGQPDEQAPWLDIYVVGYADLGHLGTLTAAADRAPRLPRLSKQSLTDRPHSSTRESG